jgi:uncharacterized membrane protein
MRSAGPTPSRKRGDPHQHGIPRSAIMPAFTHQLPRGAPHSPTSSGIPNSPRHADVLKSRKTREHVWMTQPGTERRASSPMRTIARLVLGVFLGYTGFSHLTFARNAFHAQVPSWIPLNADFVITASGVVEMLLALGLVILTRWRVPVGCVVALFFVLIFPGNISQFVTHSDAFGLDSDLSRGIRLLFQPLLVMWALWCTGAWAALRHRRARPRL